MRGYSQYFIMASILYLVIGTLIGTLSFFYPPLLSLKVVHLHLNLLGFMSMMVFGVLYHVLPRFLGQPLFSEPLAWFHFYAGNITFLILIISMSFTYSGIYPNAFEWGKWAALGQWITIVVFAFNIFRTVSLARKRS